MTNRSEQLERLLRERIVILDGAMGTMIQQRKLDEAAFRGARFCSAAWRAGPARSPPPLRADDVAGESFEALRPPRHDG